VNRVDRDLLVVESLTDNSDLLLNPGDHLVAPAARDPKSVTRSGDLAGHVLGVDLEADWNAARMMLLKFNVPTRLRAASTMTIGNAVPFFATSRVSSAARCRPSSVKDSLRARRTRRSQKPLLARVSRASAGMSSRSSGLSSERAALGASDTMRPRILLHGRDGTW
jgi:hypothetical protein